MISSAVLMVGCGGGDDIAETIERAIEENVPGDAGSGSGASDTSGSSTTDGSLQNPYHGNALIEGAIALSSLVGLDANAIAPGQQTPKRPALAPRSAFVVPREGSETADNAVVKLFSVAANGDLEDTGIACDFLPETDANGDPKYVCEGVRDGNSYVVKYVRLLEDNKAIEMKVNVQLPEGQTAVAAEAISPESTVVVDAIVKAVVSATQGKAIDPQIVKDIIASVKETVKSLVQQGVVQIPPMVVEAPKAEDGSYITNAAELAKGKKVEFAENDGLEEVTGALVARDDVAQRIDVAKVEIEVRELRKIDTDDADGKRELIRKIFSKLLGDDEVPGYIVDFFANEYVAGSTVRMDALYQATYSGLGLNPRFGLSIADLGLTGAAAVDAFSRLLERIYDLEAKRSAGSLTEEEKKALAEIPGVISVAFPAQQWRHVEMTRDTELSIPQGIVFTIFVTDRFVPEVFESKQGYKLEAVMEADREDDAPGDGASGEKTVQKVKFEDPVDFNPMHYDPSGNNPGLMQLLGFFDEAHLAKLDGVEINHIDLMPDRIWIDHGDGQGGQEYASLRANVCFTDLSAFRQMTGAGDDTAEMQRPDYQVELFYPKADATVGRVALIDWSAMAPGAADPAGGEKGGEPCFILDPWMQAQSENRQPTVADLVSDFVSGEYKVVVRDASGVVAERVFEKKIVSGMLDAAPPLLSPRGMPQWPKACQGVPGPCQAWDDLMAAWNAAGGNTTFAINADSDGDGVEDKARIVIKWGKPEVDLPEGVKVAYGLDIFRNGGCTETGDCDFENIFSSREKERRLFGRSFEVPKLLEKLEIGEGSYNVNVCAEFIDTENGDFLGSGGCSFAEFNVGEPLDLSGTFEIAGKVAPVEDSNWKVALISEPMPAFGDEPGTRAAPATLRVSAIVEGSYSLVPTIGDFLEKPVNTIFNVVMFKDDDGDDVVDFPVAGEPGERVLWPRWEKQVRFETWGRVLRVVKEEVGDDGSDRERHEIIVVGGEKVDGPDFDRVPDFSVGPTFGDGGDTASGTDSF